MPSKPDEPAPIPATPQPPPPEPKPERPPPKSDGWSDNDGLIGLPDSGDDPDF
jgi:hypothetical protein